MVGFIIFRLYDERWKDIQIQSLSRSLYLQAPLVAQ